MEYDPNAAGYDRLDNNLVFLRWPFAVLGLKPGQSAEGVFEGEEGENKVVRVDSTEQGYRVAGTVLEEDGVLVYSPDQRKVEVVVEGKNRRSPTEKEVTDTAIALTTGQFSVY